MTLSGVTIDFNDDPSALADVYSTLDRVPDVVKQAHVLTHDELRQLPDDVYALCLHEDDAGTLRKFACIDAGNTQLAVDYFCAYGHKLPVEAQKVAAANLITACEWYGLTPPAPIEKVANLGLGLSAALTAASLPGQVKGTSAAIKNNLAAAKGAGGAVLTPAQMQAAGPTMRAMQKSGMDGHVDIGRLRMPPKQAEVSGTSIAPLQGPSVLAKDRPKARATLDSVHKTAEELTTANGIAGKAPEKMPQHPEPKPLTPHVRVSSNRNPPVILRKEATHYAVGQRYYPLDSYTQVQKAAAYFERNVDQFDLEQRREFAQNLVKRASVMGIAPGDAALQYGGEGCADSVKVAFSMRRPFLTGVPLELLNQLEKNAAAQATGQFTPDDKEILALALYEFDKHAQLDHLYGQAFEDPYAAVFATAKVAENDSWTEGNDYVTKEQIENYAVTATDTIRADYDDDFLKEFKKDPWAIFSSLPLAQKKRMARAASDNSPTGMHDVAR